MSNLIGIAYPDEATATEVARTLSELQKEHSIELDDLVVAVRQDNGKIKLRQSFSPGVSGAAGGALWGGLIGLIFLAPLLGMAIGAASGGAAGALADYGIDDKFMKELGTSCTREAQDCSCWFASRRRTRSLPRISQYGGEVLHTSLSTESEEMLREALAEGAEPQQAA